MAEKIKPDKDKLQTDISPDTPHAVESPKTFNKFLPYIIIVLLLFVGGGYYAYSQHLINSLSLKPGQNTQLTPTSNEQPESQISPVYDSNSNWQFKLVNNKTKTLVTYLGPNRNNIIEKWNNYLFYPESNNAHLFTFYNMTTDKKEYVDLMDRVTDRASVTKIHIFNNELYLTIGGYLAPGGIYYSSLPLTANSKFSTLVKTEELNPHIELMNNRYIISEGFGDACTGMAKYSLLDPASKEVSFIADASFGCKDGEAFVGMDKNDRFLMSKHINNESEETGAGFPQQLYLDLTAIPVSNPSSKEILIPEIAMPQKIVNYAFSEERNDVFFLGPESYLFNIDSKEFSKIVDLDPSTVNNVSSPKWYDNYVCLKDYTANREIVINIDQKTVETDTSKCIDPEVTPTPSGTYEQQEQYKIRKQIERLDLPPEFTLTFVK